MAWEVWLTFFGAAIAISVSPGAGAIQSMATGITHGVRRGYWSILGLEVGLMLQLALVAVGLGAAVANSILAFTISSGWAWRICSIWPCGNGVPRPSTCASRSARRWTAAG
jgi:threonine/homoserine/homoserine lactone efflux protein